MTSGIVTGSHASTELGGLPVVELDGAEATFPAAHDVSA